MHIRLTKKLADALNGLDLRGFRIGDVIQLEDPLAAMLIAEKWAVTADLSGPATADDRPMRDTRNAEEWSAALGRGATGWLQLPVSSAALAVLASGHGAFVAGAV